MRNLIGTHLGHVSMYIMCRILQDASTTVDVGLVRGAVFYITAALWGKNRVTTLKCTPTSVLPSLRAVSFITPIFLISKLLKLNAK